MDSGVGILHQYCVVKSCVFAGYYIVFVHQNSDVTEFQVDIAIIWLGCVCHFLRLDFSGSKSNFLVKALHRLCMIETGISSILPVKPPLKNTVARSKAPNL